MKNFTKKSAGEFLNSFIPTLDLQSSDKDLQNQVRLALFGNFKETQGLVDFINWKANSYIVKYKYNVGKAWGGC
jgi:hypothetical protein